MGSGLLEYPYPNKSIANTLHCLPNTGVFFLQWSALPPKPWTKMIGGPDEPDCVYLIVCPSHSQNCSVTGALGGGLIWVPEGAEAAADSAVACVVVLCL